MTFTCHITHRDTKKIVKFSDNSPENIIAEIRRAFGLYSDICSLANPIKLQKYEEEWKDCVDVGASELQQGMKIKVVSASTPFSPLEDIHSLGSTSTVLLEDSSPSCDDEFESLSTEFEIPLTSCLSSSRASSPVSDCDTTRTYSPLVSTPPSATTTATMSAQSHDKSDEHV